MKLPSRASYFRFYLPPIAIILTLCRHKDIKLLLGNTKCVLQRVYLYTATTLSLLFLLMLLALYLNLSLLSHMALYFCRSTKCMLPGLGMLLLYSKVSPKDR